MEQPTQGEPHDGALDAALALGGLRAVFQPIVDLRSERVVGWEALARGAPGTALERPDRLFAAARATGRVAELDWACRTAALRAASDARLDGRLFVNVEPETFGAPTPPAAAPLWEPSACGGVVLEITERALTARPADLVRDVAELREAGWTIALDDVGSDTPALALMPLLEPDVVKLDLRLVQQHPSLELAAIVNAVRAYRERTGAPVVAEGIETAEQHTAALAMGATLGQGWYFGRPRPVGELETARLGPASARIAERRPGRGLDGTTPFEIVRAHRAVERATPSLLLAMSHQIEDQALAFGRDVIVVASFEDATKFTPDAARRYARIAEQAALVGVVGRRLPPEPAPRVRGARLDPEDPIGRQWSVAVLGHHFAVVLAAHDLHERGPDGARQFDFAITYDRDLAVAATRAIVRRLAPVG